MRLTFESGGATIPVEVFAPDRGGRYPLILMLHGSGGMQNSMYVKYAEHFAGFGYAVFAPHYFASTDMECADDDALIRLHYFTWLEAVERALAFAIGHPQVDAGRVGLLGFSLGGFLALGVASRDARVKAVVEFFGGLPEELARQCKRLPPVLILHGDADTRVPLRWAQELEAKLNECGAEYEKQIYHGAGHIFGLPAMVDAGQRALRFFQKHL